MKEELYYVLIKLLSANDIEINKEELNLQLLSHPSYPSLHALTGVLDHFNIENAAMEVPTDSSMLEQLPDPFIAHIVSEAEDFVLVEKKEDHYLIHFDQNKKESISPIDFLEIWDGVILLVEKGEGIKKDALPTFLKKTIWISFALLCISLAFFIYNTASLFSLLHFTLSLAGLYFSIAIIKHELGFASTVSDSMCNLSEQTSCDEVLNSKGAQVLGLVKLSEISLITFSIFSLTWILLFLNGSSYSSELISLSLLALPMTLYSLYYQYFIVKKWCPLCLSIVAILCLQAAAVLLVDFSFFIFELKNTLLFSISSLTTVIVASLLLPIIRKKPILEKIELEHYQFKRKFSLFNAIYSNNRVLEIMPPIAGEIVFGEKEAPLELIIVTNPFCFYCKQMHTDLENFLKNFGARIRVIIRFNVDLEKEDDKVYRITSALLDIYNREGPAILWNTLQEVYAEKVDLKKWIEKREAPQESYKNILIEQRKWCQANGINFTPAMVVNGKRFPQEYEKGDLIYFIDDLIEQME